MLFLMSQFHGDCSLSPSDIPTLENSTVFDEFNYCPKVIVTLKTNLLAVTNMEHF